MKPRFFLALILGALLITSCSGAAQPTPTTVPLPSATEPAPQPTETPAATFTPEPTDIPTVAATDTPSVPMVTPIDEPVNCRFGPGTEYAVVGALLVDEHTQVFGKTSDEDWWQVQNPDVTDQKCWVAASVTSGSGNFSAVAVVAAPTTFVTAVTLELDPETITLAACTDPLEPIQITATVDVNGPAVVKWHFETQQGGAVPEQTLEFTESGPKDVSDEFMPSPVKKGTYWVRLIVTDPNDVTMEAKYEIECP